MEKALKNIVLVSVFLILAVPLIVVANSYFPYIAVKTIILRFLIELAFLAYLPLALLNPEYRPKKNLLLWSVLFFFGVMAATTIFSQSFARSMWGNWERSMGFVNYIHYLALFLVCAGMYRKAQDWSRFFNFSLMVSLFMSIYSIAQRFGSSYTLQSGLTRVDGTMGNASYLAAYALIHFFIALLFFAEKPSKLAKIYYLLLCLTNAFILVLTGTRGAEIGLFVSLIVFIIFTFLSKLWKNKTVLVLVGLCSILVLAGAVLLYNRQSEFVKNNYWLRRLSNFSLTDNTVQTRVMAWTWGIKGFKDNLLLGVGLENYQLVFNQYFTPEFYNFSRNEIWFDRAHNTLVDMATTMGIFGILAYLFIFAETIFVLFRVYRRKKISDLPFIILILLFFSYFVQNLLVFDSLNTLIIFHVLLAYVYFISQATDDEFEDKKKENYFSWPINYTLPVSFLIFMFLFFSYNLQEVKANLNVYGAYVASRYRSYDKAVADFKLANKQTTNKLDTAVLLSTSLIDLIESNPNIAPKDQEIKDLKTAIAWMDTAIKNDPKNTFLYFIQSKNYSLLARVEQKSSDLEKALEMAQKALDLSPGRIQPLWVIAQVYYFGGQTDTAIKYLEQANKQNPTLPETYLYQAQIYKNLKNEVKFFEQYDHLIDLQYQFTTVAEIKSLMQHYKDKNDKARVFYLEDQLRSLSAD